MANMVDVSSNNHAGGAPLPWCEFPKHGIRAAMDKASEGTGYVNPWLARDANGARASGILVGYYHFAHPAQSTPAEQVAAFAKAVEGLPHEIGLALDLEAAEGLSWADLGNWAHAFLDRLAEHAEWTILYSNRSWLEGLPGAPWGHRLWLASPGQRPRQKVWAWQYGTGAVAEPFAGIDVNELYELPKVA